MDPPDGVRREVQLTDVDWRCLQLARLKGAYRRSILNGVVAGDPIRRLTLAQIHDTAPPETLTSQRRWVGDAARRADPKTPELRFVRQRGQPFAPLACKVAYDDVGLEVQVRAPGSGAARAG